MKLRNYYLVNAITAYRILAAPVLVWLIFTDRSDIFKWLLPVSFFTDLIDGFLARKFKVTSIFGSKLDSLADDLTFIAATIGILVLKLDFVIENIIAVGILLALYLFQISLALIKYGKMTSFHTYFGKLATLLQGFFLIFIFLLPQPIYALFYVATVITAIDLIEEIVLIFSLKSWQANVKGLYWILKKRSSEKLV